MRVQLNEKEIAIALRSWAREAFEMVDGMTPTDVVLREQGSGIVAEITLEPRSTAAAEPSQ